MPGLIDDTYKGQRRPLTSRVTKLTAFLRGRYCLFLSFSPPRLILLSVQMRSNPSLQQALQLVVFIVCCHNVLSYQPFGSFGRSVPNPNKVSIDQPVVKSLRRPLLIVVDPKTKSRIHLVGVSHGSASSAELVKAVFSEIPKAAAVVLELCDDRFWSISLDAKIRPRGNETLAKAFDTKLEMITNYEKKKKAEMTSNSGAQALYSQISNTLRFASGQGLIGGTFVLLGLFVSNLQRMTRSNTGTSWMYCLY